MKQQRGRVVVAVRTLALKDGRVLLVGHRDPKTDRVWWMAPGGMVDAGETAIHAAAREVKEETGLDVVIQGLVYWLEWVSKSYYCLELYFTGNVTGGTVLPGTDPELADSEQFIFDARFFGVDEMKDFAVYPEVLRTLLAEHSRQGFPRPAMYLGVSAPDLPR